MTTIKDVAKRADVSISTVSNALNGLSNVSDETRERVLKAASELNYFPNINAQLLKTRKTNNIGIFLPNINSSFYTRLIQAMYTTCNSNRYSLLVHVSNAYSSRQLAAAILSSNVDGAVILNENLKDCDLELLRTKKVPFVFLDKRLAVAKMSSVLIDNAKGIMQILEYLVHTGHQTIGFIRGSDNYDGQERYRAFLQGMEKLHLRLYPELVGQGFFDPDAAYSAVRGCYSHLSHIPDAILCSNDDMALGCIRALKDLGARVPEDVSVVGFDDGEAAGRCDPPLTTVQIPIKDFGKQAVEELIRLMQPDAVGRSIYQDVQLVIRKSCAIRFKGEI